MEIRNRIILVLRNIYGVDALKNRVRKHLEASKAYIVFDVELEHVWPSARKHRLVRAKSIQAFAKNNGWTATIVDPGIKVTFRKAVT